MHDGNRNIKQINTEISEFLNKEINKKIVLKISEKKPLKLLEYHRVSTLKQVNDMTIKDQRYAIKKLFLN